MKILTSDAAHPRSHRLIASFYLLLILLGVGRVLAPIASALLLNLSTLGISLKSMTDPFPKPQENPKKPQPV